MKPTASNKKGTNKKQNTNSGLVIANKGKKVLSKHQREFNRLVKMVEQLRKQLENNSVLLDSHLEYYGAHIHPLELTFLELRKEQLRLIMPYITEKKMLTKREKEAIKSFANDQLDEIIMLMDGEPDDELKAIFSILKGVSFDEAQAEQFEDMKEEFSDMFRDMGYDVNFDGLNKDMSQEEIAEKLSEMQQQFEEMGAANGAKHSNKKKTKKQIEQELKEKQKEEAKKKTVSSIYKQLAKILHPDLESDPVQKLLKEEVMKQLTTAYENNDLHTLLRLEIEWVERNEEKIIELADDKLSVYNIVLKEQVEELEESIDELPEHPRFMPLMRFTDYEYLVTHKTLAGKKEQITGLIEDLTESIRFELKGGGALKLIKEIAHSKIQQEKYDREMAKLFDNFIEFPDF